METWSVTQTDGDYSNIADAIELLTTGERQGREVDARGLPEIPVGKHRVDFRRSDYGIDVVRILQQGMEVNLHLRPRLPRHPFTWFQFG